MEKITMANIWSSLRNTMGSTLSHFQRWRRLWIQYESRTCLRSEVCTVATLQPLGKISISDEQRCLCAFEWSRTMFRCLVALCMREEHHEFAAQWLQLDEAQSWMIDKWTQFPCWDYRSIGLNFKGTLVVKFYSIVMFADTCTTMLNDRQMDYRNLRVESRIA